MQRSRTWLLPNWIGLYRPPLLLTQAWRISWRMSNVLQCVANFHLRACHLWRYNWLVLPNLFTWRLSDAAYRTAYIQCESVMGNFSVLSFTDGAMTSSFLQGLYTFFHLVPSRAVKAVNECRGVDPSSTWGGAPIARLRAQGVSKGGCAPSSCIFATESCNLVNTFRPKFRAGDG